MINLKKLLIKLINTGQNMNESEDSIMNTLFPPGSIYITSTNNNPSTWLGGTWTLVDKQFADRYVACYQDGNGITWNQTNMNYQAQGATYPCWSCIMNKGHYQYVYMQGYNKVAFTDTSVSLATYSPPTNGLIRVHVMKLPIPLFDGLNGICLPYIDTYNSIDSVNISSNDLIMKAKYDKAVGSKAANAYPSTVNQWGFWDMWLVPHGASLSYMDDAFCNRFYWKRVDPFANTYTITTQYDWSGEGDYEATWTDNANHSWRLYTMNGLEVTLVAPSGYKVTNFTHSNYSNGVFNTSGNNGVLSGGSHSYQNLLGTITYTYAAV